jgi:hypothetical protein
MLQWDCDDLHLAAGEHAPAVDARAIARVVPADDLTRHQDAPAEAQIDRPDVLLAHQVIIQSDGTDQTARAVGHHQAHGGSPPVHHFFEDPKETQQQLFEALGLMDTGGHVVKDLERGGLLRETHGLASDSIVHLLVELGQLLVEAPDVLSDAIQDTEIAQGIARPGLTLTDPRQRVLQSSQRQQKLASQPFPCQQGAQASGHQQRKE